MNMPILMNNRIGTINKNAFGSVMKIIEYNRADDMWVKFEKGEPIKTCWNSFINGKVRNVYDKSNYGVGYLGEGNYKTSINGKRTQQYTIWNSMLKRCYSEKHREEFPTYEEVSVCEEWHNFQNFAKWYDENYYDFDESLHLDKDILIKGNKVYSPETCVFVPYFINLLFLKKESKRGDFPIGVTFHKYKKKYQAACANGKGKQLYLGYYSTPEEAFRSHKKYKENLIKQLAEEHKDKIPFKLYNAMISYIVEIDD